MKFVEEICLAILAKYCIATGSACQVGDACQQTQLGSYPSAREAGFGLKLCTDVNYDNW